MKLFEFHPHPNLPASRARRLLLTAFLLFAGPACEAHDFWIEPDSFTVVSGQPVVLSLREGVDFEGVSLGYNPGWFRDFSYVDRRGRRPVRSLTGDDPAAMLEIAGDSTIIGYYSNRNLTELDRETFSRYIEEEGLEYIQDTIAELPDDAPIPEFFVRCAKASLTSSTQDSELYRYAFGYPLEIIPAVDPGKLKPGERLRVQVFFRNAPAAGLLLQAQAKSNPENILKIRTDQEGFAEIIIADAGVWLLKVVKIQSIIGSPQATLQSFWASYVFNAGGHNLDD